MEGPWWRYISNSSACLLRGLSCIAEDSPPYFTHVMCSLSGGRYLAPIRWRMWLVDGLMVGFGYRQWLMRRRMQCVIKYFMVIYTVYDEYIWTEHQGYGRVKYQEFFLLNLTVPIVCCIQVEWIATFSLFMHWYSFWRCTIVLFHLILILECVKLMLYGIINYIPSFVLWNCFSYWNPWLVGELFRDGFPYRINTIPQPRNTKTI